jgi:hypothetical protein
VVTCIHSRLALYIFVLGGHHCLTYRTMTDTVNSLDAVRVHDRLSGNKDQYETFCGLSGYSMTLVASQPERTGITNGYCLEGENYDLCTYIQLESNTYGQCFRLQTVFFNAFAMLQTNAPKS